MRWEYEKKWKEKKTSKQISTLRLTRKKSSTKFRFFFFASICCWFNCLRVCLLTINVSADKIIAEVKPKYVNYKIFSRRRRFCGWKFCVLWSSVEVNEIEATCTSTIVISFHFFPNISGILCFSIDLQLIFDSLGKFQMQFLHFEFFGFHQHSSNRCLHPISLGQRRKSTILCWRFRADLKLLLLFMHDLTALVNWMCGECDDS